MSWWKLFLRSIHTRVYVVENYVDTKETVRKSLCLMGNCHYLSLFKKNHDSVEKKPRAGEEIVGKWLFLKKNK